MTIAQALEAAQNYSIESTLTLEQLCKSVREDPPEKSTIYRIVPSLTGERTMPEPIIMRHLSSEEELRQLHFVSVRAKRIPYHGKIALVMWVSDVRKKFRRLLSSE